MKPFTFLFLVIIGISTFGQTIDTLNQTDSKGKKQGLWCKKDKNGKKIYEGRFKDGVPYGEFKYFYPEGGIKAQTVISKNGTVAKTVTFFRNGKKNAEGYYLNEKRDSTWKFYSEVDATLVSEEFYKEGKKEGKCYNYYPGEGKAEMITYKNDVKDGPWEMYFPEGAIKLKGAYKNGEKNGPFQVNFFFGKPMITGYYTNGIPTGTWIYFKETGGVKKRETYDKGRVVTVDSTGK